MKEIQRKSILVRVSARFELVRVRGLFELSEVAVTIYRPETQTNKLKLTLANSSLLSDFRHFKKCHVCLSFVIKMRKMAKLRQKLQISHSDVIRTLRYFRFRDWEGLRNLGMIVQNGGHFGECRYVLASNVLCKTSELMDV